MTSLIFSLTVPQWGMTAIIYAATFGHTDLVKILMHKADLKIEVVTDYYACQCLSFLATFAPLSVVVMQGEDTVFQFASQQVDVLTALLEKADERVSTFVHLHST